MKDSLTLESIAEGSIIIHGPKMDDYYERRIKRLSEVFLFNNNIVDEGKLPLIKWKVDQSAPTYAFLYILTSFEDELSTFCEEILKHYLFYDKKIPIVFTNNLYFSFRSRPSKMLEFKEICLKIDQEEHLHYLKKNKSKISRDLSSGLRFPSYISEFLKLNRSHFNLNTPVLYETINNLLVKFPGKIDKQIFTDLQHFLIFATDPFTMQHSLKYVLKVIFAYYFFKKEIEYKSKAYPNQRHIKIKMSNTKLYYPFGHKGVLGIFLALNIKTDKERFGKKHIAMILDQVLPNYSFIQNSFFLFQIGTLSFLYLDLKKKDNVGHQRLNGIIETLTNEIKNSIETISSRVISYRNEEEIYRSIILLKDQLQYREDLPQVVISFHEHFGENLKFHAIILRLVKRKKTPIKKNIDLFSKASIYVEKTIQLEPLDDDYTKEATIIRISFSSSDFIRKDHSIDLLKARNFASKCIAEIVGEFRDFNGGYIDQQRKNFYQLKQLLGKIESKNEVHVESLFYSLVPVTVQASFSSDKLKKLFLFFLKSLSMEVPFGKDTLSLIEQNDDSVYFFVKSKDIGLKDAFFPSMEEIFFDPFNFALTSVEIDAHLYLGFIFLHPENPKSFVSKINKIIRRYFQSKKAEQSLCINLPRPGYSLDPRVDGDRHSGVLIKMLYEGLTRIGTSNRPELALADKVAISENKKTYIFHLKETYWSNKSRVTAYDFEYAWKKILDPNIQKNHAFMFYSIKNAEAIKKGKRDFSELGIYVIDEKTLRIDLEYPMPYFLSLTAHWIYSPLCKDVCQIDPGWAYFGENEYVSNGPFKIDTWERDKEITLAKNQDYWDVNSVKLNQIKAINVEDENTLLSMFDKGKIHWLGEPLSLVPSKVLNSKDYQNVIKTHQTSALFWLMLNVKSYPVRSKFIRQALAYSLNRGQIIEKVLGKKASVATQISNGYEFCSTKYSFKDADYERAGECFNLGLNEMGLSKNNFPNITLTFSPSEQYEELFLEISKQWREVLGIEVILKRVPVVQLRKALKFYDFQVSGYIHYSWSDDPIYHFDYLKSPGYQFNGTQWRNPLFSSLISQAQNELNPGKREKIIANAESVILQDMPVIPVYFYNYRFVQPESLKKVILSNVGQIDFKYSELT